MHKKIEYIKTIDQNDKLYNSIVKEPIFINDKYIDIMKKIGNEKLNFFYYIFARKKKFKKN